MRYTKPAAKIEHNPAKGISRLRKHARYVERSSRPEAEAIRIQIADDLRAAEEQLEYYNTKLQDANLLAHKRHD